MLPNSSRFLGLRPHSDTLLAAIVAAVHILSPSSHAQSKTDASQPNIVVLLADDLGWSDLACYGGDVHETPNLDAFARTAVRFTQAYSAAPICSPTRAALLTGKHPARLHMTTWYEAAANPTKDRKLLPPATIRDLPLAEVTLAERLHAAGYFAAHVGKWHLGDAAHYPEAQGFDLNIGGTFWGAPATHFFPYRGPFGTAAELRYVPGLALGKPGEYLADRLTEEAIRIIERVKDRPFFLSLWHHAVHTPTEAPTPLVEYSKSKIAPHSQHKNPAYAAMVANLDQNVGRLLASLDRLALSDRTLVIFTSDNGGYINEYHGEPVTSNYPLRSGKGSLYEGGIRVPLLVRWPGKSTQATVSEVPVVTMDLYPTILDAARVVLPPDDNPAIDGMSLAPLLAGQSPTKLLDRPLFFHYPHYYATTSPVSAIRNGNWKLLEYFEDDRVELFNLANDPSERTDLAAQQPAIATRLRAQLSDWRKNSGAQMPTRRP